MIQAGEKNKLLQSFLKEIKDTGSPVLSKETTAIYLRNRVHLL